MPHNSSPVLSSQCLIKSPGENAKKLALGSLCEDDAVTSRESQCIKTEPDGNKGENRALERRISCTIYTKLIGIGATLFKMIFANPQDNITRKKNENEGLER